MKLLICTLKTWNIKNAQKFASANQHNTRIIQTNEQFNVETIKEFNPDYIFFPHWSYMIPEEIYNEFKCVVFHMTDLPYGRGGSPLQNLIANGIEHTQISAIKVVKELDAGPIYMKHTLDLYGTAEEIYIRASEIIFTEMIPEIINNNITPAEQEGEVVTFKRRKPEDGMLTSDMSINTIYNYIRMLDAEGYPNSYINYGNMKLSFSKASIKDGKVVANVEIEVTENE